ncbi:MAG: DUF192 domain-containing protein [archaeon]
MIVKNIRTGGKYKVEVKKTLRERTLGLSRRGSLADDAGILMDFGYSRRHGIWMWKMLFPLDIVFVDEKRRVVTVQSARPITSDPKTWKVYYPKTAVRYVLELNTNSGFSEGDTLEWKDSARLSTG